MQRFPLGQLMITPGALAALKQSKQTPLPFLYRHVSGDWGDLDAEDQEANDFAVVQGGRILSAYTLNAGVKIWCINEADRSVTTILLPEEE